MAEPATITLTSPPTMVIEPGACLLEGSLDSGATEFEGQPPQLLVNGVLVVADWTLQSPSEYTFAAVLDLRGPQVVQIGFRYDTVLAADLTSSVALTVLGEAILAQDRDYILAAAMEGVVSYLPEYTLARQHWFSVYQQFMNPIALELDRNRVRLFREEDSKSILTTDINFPTEVRVLDLDEDDLEVSVLPDGTLSTKSPVLYGLDGYNRIQIERAPSLLSFFEEGLPTSFEAERLGTIPSPILLSAQIAELHSSTEFELQIPSRLYIEVSGSTGLVDTELDSPSFGRNAFLVVKGKSKYGMQVEESISLLKDGVYSTKYEYQSTESITPSFKAGAAALVTIYQFPVMDTEMTDPLRTKLVGQVDRAVEWVHGSDQEGSYLDLSYYVASPIEDVLREEDSRVLLDRHHLLDMAGNPVSPYNIQLTDSHTFFIGADADHLYLWERRDTLPQSLAILKGATENPEQDFAVTKLTPTVHENGLPTTRLLVETFAPRKEYDIDSWYWAVVSPSGTRSYLDRTFSVVSQPVPRGNGYENEEYGIRERGFEITVLGFGMFTIELYVTLKDRTLQTTRRPILVHGKKPVAQYKLSHLVGSVGDVYVHMGRDSVIMVMRDGEVFRLHPRFETFILETEAFGSRVLTRAPYDQVEVENGG